MDYEGGRNAARRSTHRRICVAGPSGQYPSCQSQFRSEPPSLVVPFRSGLDAVPLRPISQSDAEGSCGAPAGSPDERRKVLSDRVKAQDFWHFSVPYFASVTTALPTTVPEAVSIEIGGMAIGVRTHDSSFRRLIENRYASFVGNSPSSHFDFDIDLYEPSESASPDDGLEVKIEAGEWLLKRGDFRARWNPDISRGYIRQSRSPYAIDCVLRIVHSLILARQGGFLVHAASAIRGGKAFLFSGVSGAGKTTISRLAPPDAALLTDEISYVRREGNRYLACGTPFAGELARVGENQSAPLSALFLLEKGLQNSIEPVSATEAIRRLLRNILFFADDAELVKLVFQSACEFASLVPIHRLIFVPDPRVWDIIR